MTKPADPATWDSNSTNLVAAVAGHITDGYANSEIPTSAETNGWMNNVGQWTEWLDGLWDGSGNLTLDPNASVTVSGTGTHKHGDNVLNVQPLEGNIDIVAGAATWLWSDNGYLVSNAAGAVRFGIPLIVGQQIKTIVFELFGDGAADLTVDIAWRPKNSTKTDEFSGDVITNPPASWADHTYDVSNRTIVDGDVYWMKLTASAANLQIGAIRVTFDRVSS